MVLTIDGIAHTGENCAVNLLVWKNIRKRADSCNNFGRSSQEMYEKKSNRFCSVH